MSSTERRAKVLIEELKSSHPAFSIYFLQLVNTQMMDFMKTYGKEVRKAVETMEPWHHDKLKKFPSSEDD